MPGDLDRDRLHPPYAAFVSTGAARPTQMLEVLRHGAARTTRRSLRRLDWGHRWRTAGGRRPRRRGKGADLEASPTNEAAVLGLAGQVVPPLGKGAGILLIEDGGDYRVEPLDR